MTDKKTKEKLQKIKKLLSEKNGQIDEQIKNDIIEITTNNKRKKAVDAAKNLSKAAKEYDSDEAISNLGDIEQPDIVKEAIKKTMSSLLDPVRASFMTEMARYVDSISLEETITRQIPRVVKQKTIKKIVNGEFVPITTSNDLVVNPDFKQLLSTGYKPQPDSSEYQKHISNLSALASNIGTPESDYIKNKDGNDITGIQNKVELVSGTLNIPAGLFKNAFTNAEENINYNNNDKFKEISLSGFTKTDKDIKDKKYKSPSYVEKPNWVISYKEQGSKYILNIENNHEFFINNKITINTSSYSFLGKLEDVLSSGSRRYINDNLQDCESYNNDELYSEMIVRDNAKIFERQQEINTITRNFKNFLISRHPQVVSSLIGQFFSSYKQNRLLRKFKLPKIKGLEQEDVDKASNLIILNLINFIPEVSQELIDCGKQPHPLNLDQIIDLMVKKFSTIGTQVVPKKEFCSTDVSTEPKNALTEASSLGTAILLVRLIVLENILKSLFIFDEHEYSTEMIQGSLYTDFVYVKVIESLNNLKLRDEIEDIVIENYELLKDNNIIIPADEQQNSNIESIRVNGDVFNTDNLELKYFTKSLIRKTTGYLKNLIGTVPATQEEEKVGLLQLLSNDKIYDIVEDQTADYSRQILESSQRFNEITQNDFFVLEKYFSVDLNTLFKQSYFNGPRLREFLDSLKQKYSYMQGCVSFTKYSKFIDELITDIARLNLRGNIAQKLELILNNPKIGLRLVEVFSKTSSQGLLPDINAAVTLQVLTAFNSNIKNTLNNFDFLNGISADIKSSEIKNKKMYGFYDINNETKTINFYNSIPLSEVSVEVPISNIVDNNSNIADLNAVFENNKGQLLNKIINDPKYDIMLNKAFFLNKIPNLAVFHSHCALTNSATENLFAISKKKILDFYDSAVNIKNYKHKNSTEKAGGTMAKYQQDISNIGNPNGGPNFDILQFFITTPILILKGITNLMDPNISIASQIVNAAAAGLLFPTEDDNGNLQYPGDPVILPTVLASLALLPLNIIPPPPISIGIGPPVTPLPGMLYWALEPLLWKLPFFQNQATKSSAAKKLKNDPSFKGLSIGGEGKFKCDIDQDE